MSRDRRDPPPPDEEASAAEKSRADGFARLVDGLLAGEPIPPAMDPDDRALLETATVVVASTQEVRLSDASRRSLVDEALEEAVTGRRRRSSVPDRIPTDDAGVSEDTEVISTGRRRSDRMVRALPWAVASLAAAAAIFLFVTRPEDLGESARQAAARSVLTSVHLSRPADPLIGQIDREGADQASSRLDVIYTDRLAGYRDLRLRGLGRRGGDR